MSPSAGFLIYSGVMPLLKTFIAIGFGFLISWKGLFPPQAYRGASQVTMNIALPCLMFSSMVPAFNHDNISAIGPLLLLSAIYMAFGFIGGMVIREVFYVPRNFWQGLIVMCGMSNWGNLPNAIVITVTGQDPFDPSKDPQLGVSYVAIFILAFNIVFWSLGAANSLAWDYADDIPQKEDAERRYPWYEKPLGSLLAKYILRLPITPPQLTSAEKEKYKENPSALEASPVATSIDEAEGTADPDIRLARQISAASSSFRSRQPSSSQAARPTDLLPTHTEINSVGPSRSTTPLGLPSITVTKDNDLLSQHTTPNTNRRSTRRIVPPIVVRIFHPVLVILNPVTISVFVSIPCALVPQLKALFVDATQMGGPDWKGPDGRPPLTIFFDAADFVGAIAVPMGLILLGANFARMKIPRPISRLPIPAMITSALVKLVLLPVMGVFIVQAMVRNGLIPQEAKAEKFVAMFLSGTPAAVNQVIVSTLYAPDGELDTLTAFLLIQYALMFFTSAYALLAQS
ncbi:auxin efflux carrier [Flagelloscypha sp. PMI_526]|nr:auxin efflux carrier [Flagelloscypha sp. PMI_526]